MLLAVVPCPARAQDSVTLPPVCSVPAAVSFFAPIVFPFKILQDEAVMRDYVVSPEFAAVRRAAGDRGAVDDLFRRALERTWNNTAEACLVCLLAVLDHRTLGFKLPHTRALVWVPLTGEFEEEYRARVSALPARLYADTPPEGDRDKLQHFFGSAFLTILCESTSSSDAFGEFVENEEEAIVVGGTRDARDIRANRQGQRFALALMNRLDTLPSPFLVPGSGAGTGRQNP